MIKKILVIMIMGMALSACGSDQASSPAPTQASVNAEALPATSNNTTEDIADPTNTPAAVAATAVPVPEQPSSETSAAQTEAGQTSTVIEPIAVTYFTPAQGEGPYYTVEKPAERDNDLTVLAAGATGTPAGQVIEFSGKVYNANGLPLTGLTVEIWQTDANGIYLHPGDPSTANRDRNFQFYGESVSAADGSYSFRTILPGRYEPRPQHIHLKVKHGEQELLTSQIYFEGDPSLEADGLFLSAGGENEHLIMTIEAGQDSDGTPILVGEHNLILNTALSTITE